MFNRVTLLLAKLPLVPRLKFLRAMIEGDMSEEDVVNRLTGISTRVSDAKGEVLQGLLDEAKAIREDFDRMKGRSSGDSEDSEKPRQLLEQFRKLSPQERMNQAEEYERNLKKLIKEDSRIFDQFNRIRVLDNTFLAAVHYLTELFFKKAYQDKSVKSTELIAAFNAFKANPMQPCKLTNPEFLEAVREFQSNYDTLRHSIISQAQKDCLKELVGAMFVLEIQHRAPYCKTMRCLLSMKALLEGPQEVKDSALSFQNHFQTHLATLKGLLAPLSGELLILDTDIEENISTIIGIFNSVYGHVLGQQKGNLTRGAQVDKYWQKLKAEMDEVAQEEAVLLEIASEKSEKSEKKEKKAKK